MLVIFQIKMLFAFPRNEDQRETQEAGEK